MNNARVIVVGGGISGLSAAYDLARAGVEHTLFERDPRVGGVIETRTWENCVLECGPDSFLSAKPEAAALIRELGLDGDLIGSNDHQRVTYVLRKGRLVPLPEGLMMMIPTRVWPMLKTPLVGWGTKFRMGMELFRKPQTFPDRSVAAFVADHFGRETVEYLAEPLLSGIYGGDPDRLSAPSVLGRMVEMESTQGSLSRAMLRARSANSGQAPGSLFRTLKRGLGCMVDALASKVNVKHQAVDAIERRDSGGFRVRAGGDWIDAQQVILAGPAWSASELVRPLDDTLSARLGEIAYSSSAIVTLVYRDSEFDGRRAGFGFLVPRAERKKMLAGTFVATKFPHRAPDDRVVLRCFLGGIGDEAVLTESDESLLAIAREELRGILGLTAAPEHHVIARWPRSMAQYTVGHSVRVQEITQRAAAVTGLHLAGNAYHGIGIPDCIRLGREAAARAIQYRQ
ncbi:MAG TPA: protoporphyrinogen oxidase [Bryobacteraceae bacterium]|nr:protoporphyrinogen oxidase [Bryobacteraceae bacterium]